MGQSAPKPQANISQCEDYKKVRTVAKKKVPMARKDDTVKDLDQNGMLSSKGWREHKRKKKTT